MLKSNPITPRRSQSRPLGQTEEQRSAARRGGRTYERSAGAVIFFRREKEILFLLTRYKSYTGGHWEFPRGHIEPGETELATVRREVREETGLRDINIIPGFREITRFHFRDRNTQVTKDAIFYLGEARTLRVTLSAEHLGYVWLTYRAARSHIKFDAAKLVLDAAQKFLQPAPIKKV